MHFVIAEFRHDLVLGRFFKLGDVLCRVVAFSSACVNPVLYGWMNDRYRAAFVALFSRRRRRGGAADVGKSPAAARPRSIRTCNVSDGRKGGCLEVGGSSGDANNMVIELQLTPMMTTTSQLRVD